MNTVVRMLLPMVLPRIQKEAATYAADFLNRRHRRRFGIPEPEPDAQTCPPCPVPAERAARIDTVKGLLSVAASIVVGVILGAAVGALVARK